MANSAKGDRRLLLGRCACAPPSGRPLPGADPHHNSLCRLCVKRALTLAHERRRNVQTEHTRLRDACAVMIDKRPTEFGQLEANSERLRQRLQTLQQHCNKLALQAATSAVENDQRHKRLQSFHEARIARDHLFSLEASLQQGCMTMALQQSRLKVRKLRFSWALQAFLMHRLDVGESSSSSLSNNHPPRHRKQQQARGIGKIGGLPLPHAGPELYGFLPAAERVSALRLVASVTTTVAQCLGIPLPHPIFLQHPTNSDGDPVVGKDIVEMVQSEKKLLGGSEATAVSDKNNLSLAQPLASLQSSLASLWSGSTAGHFARDNSSGRQQPLALLPRSSPPRTSSISAAAAATSQPNMEATVVHERVQYATAAVLAESETCTSSKYVLADDDETALQLLQNDIVILCIRAGVNVVELQPAQAVLLNLHALQLFCRAQLDADE